MTIPDFKDKKDLFKFLVENEDLLITQKKMEMKKADGFSFNPIITRGDVSKGIISTEELLSKDTIEVSVVINSTNVFDSHKDLHIPGMWDKSLKENKRGLHLQEHSASFKNIIASGEDLDVYVKTVTWKSLGFNYEGKTQILVHDSRVHKSRNPYMHEQYAKGYVTNHSVGMRYVKMVTCINDEDYPVQKENWDKYFPMGVNKEAAEEWGYFWAQLEAKYIEGSAVAMGSNHLTPTMEIKSQIENKEENAIKQWLLS